MIKRRKLPKNKGPKGSWMYMCIALAGSVSAMVVLGHFLADTKRDPLMSKKSPRVREWLLRKAREKNLYEQELARLAQNTVDMERENAVRRKWKLRPEEIMNTIYSDRRNVLLDQCGPNPEYSTSFNSSLVITHFHYLSKYRMVFCSAEKVGSTFWRRLLQQVSRGVLQSPYWIRPEHVMDQQKTFAELKQEEIKDVLSTFTSFLFVRDPYARLWSAYVDKIFSPNSVYWATYGIQIVKMFRNNSSPTSQRCGHDVTFREFVQFIIYLWEKDKLIDPHFVPISTICLPCFVKFDLIGHLETFTADMQFFLTTFHLDDYVTAIKSSDISAIDDAIYDAVQAYFSMKTYVDFCISEDEALTRIWRKMIYRGILKSNFVPPNNITLSLQNIIESLKDDHLKSRNDGLTMQKRKLMTSEYHDVPLEDMKKLAKIYYSDFKLFGYNPYPYSLFARENLALDSVS